MDGTRVVYILTHTISFFKSCSFGDGVPEQARARAHTHTRTQARAHARTHILSREINLI